MPFVPNLSLRRKQMLIIMLTSTVALLLACSAFIAYEMMAFRGEMKRNLLDLATQIADRNTGNLTFDEPDKATNTLYSILAGDPNVVSACIYSESGIPFATYYRDFPKKNFVPPAVEQDEVRFAGDQLVAFQEIRLGDEKIGTVFLKSDLQGMYARFARYFGIVGLVLLISTLAAFFLSMRLQAVVSRPILELAELAKKVSHEKNYSVRARRESRDEIGTLFDGFNEMLTQIQRRDSELQKARDELEARVQERTRELQSEIEERTRAEEHLQQQFTRINLLNQITRGISERQDLNSIVHVVLRQLQDRLPVDFGSVLLFNAKNNEFNVAAMLFKNAKATSVFNEPNKSIPLEQTGLEECIKQKIVYHCDPSRTNSDSILLKSLAKAGLCSLATVPLMVENQLFGLLLTGRTAANSFNSRECEFLHMLSEHVALAAHQAQLHTELRNTYEELRQTQQAVMQQERLRALGKMASGIAHDINNALSPIVVYTEILLRNEKKFGEAEIKHLKNIQVSAEDIAHIVSRMREFYRKRDEAEELVNVNVNELVQQVIDLTRPRWRDIPHQRGINIEIQTHIAPDLPVIQANPSEVREAVTNLILNAADAMPQGGTVTVQTHVRNLGNGNSGTRSTHVLIDISDTGMGMDEETRTRCFEPFFSTKGQRGTGLGLAMVYGIMERHEGFIEIESVLNQGTTMRLVFPVRDSKNKNRGLENGEVRPIIPQKILCIDDEPLLREILKEILELDGHQVVSADGGQSGIDSFHESYTAGQRFDIVITDLGMPYVNGRQVVTAIKGQSPSTPVIMLTGWGTLMKSDNEIPEGVDAIVSKPPRINELRETIARFVKPQI